MATKSECVVGSAGSTTRARITLVDCPGTTRFRQDADAPALLSEQSRSVQSR
jgi:hypothetical protein